MLWKKEKEGENVVQESIEDKSKIPFEKWFNSVNRNPFILLYADWDLIESPEPAVLVNILKDNIVSKQVESIKVVKNYNDPNTYGGFILKK